MYWNPKSITSSGGEPMIREDFFDIASFLRENYTGIITLSTNGTLITKDNVAKLCDLVDQIDISIDGIDEESCAKIRGRGVFGKVLNSVDLIHECDFTNVSLSMVFSDTNEMYEEQFYELNKKLGTKALPRIYADIGRAKKNREQFTSKTKNESYIPLSFLQEEHIDADCGVSQTITHLTEKQKLLQSYDYYLNMSGRKSFAEFEYIFAFGEHEVIYRYRKTDINTLQDESLSINDKEVIYYDFAKKEGFTLLEGSDTLNATIKNDSPISRVKYVNSNSSLVDNTENKVFKKFIDFDLRSNLWDLAEMIFLKYISFSTMMDIKII